MELGLPSIGEPPYYLVQRIAARNLILGAWAAVYRGASVLFGAEEGRRTEGGGEGGSKIEI